MKVICNRGALLEALNITGNVVAARTPKPVLLCVRLAATATELTISATDLEVAIVYRDAQVEVGQVGEIVVPADKMRDIVRECIDDTLTIELVDDMAHVKGQNSFFKIYTQQADAFPPIPGVEGKADFEIQGKQLKLLISQTIFAAAREATRYAFNGILLAVKGKRVSFVGTDGRRLAEARGDLISGGGATEKDGPRAIIPTKALSLIDKLVDDPEEAVSFQVKENQIVVSTPRATLTSTLIEGQFPPYEDVVPKDTDRKVTAATNDLLGAVRQASLLTTDESKGVKMSFSKKGLVLSSSSPGAGEATVNFPCKLEGADIEMGFNPAFVIEALKAAGTDEVTLEMTAPNRPGLIRGGPNFLCVVMPVNLTS